MVATTKTTSTTLVQVFAEHAAERPGAAALETISGRVLTFADVFRQMEETRRQLRRLGIGPQDRIATVLPDGPEAALAFISIAAAAVAAPLNPAFRATRYPFYLENIPARALIVPAGSGDEVVDVARSLGIQVIELVARDGSGAFDLAGDAGALAVTGGSEPVADDTALVLYTSGTTADPKLVPLTHGNLTASARFVADALRLSPSDRALHVVPMFHIQGLVTTLLAPLAAGGAVVCAPGFQPHAFLGWVAASRATWYTAVPTMHQAVVDRARQQGCTHFESRLRFVRSSAAVMPAPLVDQIESFYGVPLIDGYGMTEAAPIIASNPLPPGRRKRGSVGLPAGPELQIVDEEGQPVPPGVIGEIAVRGANVMHGYDRNPEANAAAFVDGWFRTGDQGYRDLEGYIFLTGRLKDIINRGGEKIAPCEVEEILQQHPGVAEVAVFGVPDGRLGQTVGAAVVPRPGVEVTEQQLREFTARRLAFFKIPTRILFVPEIPRSATGKLQRAAMAEQLGLSECRAAADRTEETQPLTPMQRDLVAIWCETLSIESVGPDDNFFVLGGDSLSFVEMLYQVREQFGVDLPVQGLVQTPTIGALAARIEAARQQRSRPAAIVPARTSSRLLSRTETRLLEIWKDVLCAEPGSVSDNFFDLGGEAVPIARLFERIREEFALDLPVRTLLESPTIETMARVIDAARPPATLLVPIQPHGSATPVFGIHDGAGYFFYRALATRVGANRPFYTVQADTHLNGWRQPYAGSAGIEQLAARYIGEIRAVQPHGPYHLAGASFGGVVAFEMARQLERAGEEVGTLCLLASYVWNNPRRPDAAQPSAGSVRRAIDRIKARLATLLIADTPTAAPERALVGGGPVQQLAAAARLVRAAASDHLRWRWSAFLRRPVPPKLIHDRYLRASRYLISQYWPDAFSGRIVFFRASEDKDPAPVWEGLSAALEIHEIPGRHMDMMKAPMVETVAARMRDAIESAEAARPETSEALAAAV